MSTIVDATLNLEAQLRKDGYKGTHRALRILKNLRAALVESGYTFDDPLTGSDKRNTKKSK